MTTIIKFNAEEFRRDVDKVVKKLEKISHEVAHETAIDIITNCTNQLLQESVNRTPIDEGFLIASQVTKVEHGASAKAVTGSVYIPANSPASNYALPLHEGHYNLGEKSQQKQSESTVAVGRKFLERALYENIDEFRTYILKKLKEKLK